MLYYVLTNNKKILKPTRKYLKSILLWALKKWVAIPKILCLKNSEVENGKNQNKENDVALVVGQCHGDCPFLDDLVLYHWLSASGGKPPVD